MGCQFGDSKADDLTMLVLHRQRRQEEKSFLRGWSVFSNLNVGAEAATPRRLPADSFLNHWE